MRLTILFDAPYWVGVLEVERDGLLHVARHIFGAEPNEQEVYEFVQRDLLKLLAQMTVGVPVEKSEHKQVNPKRVQREVRRDMLLQGISTKAQDAMRLQIEQNKHHAMQVNREQRDALKTYKRDVGRLKAKAKQGGRYVLPASLSNTALRT